MMIRHKLARFAAAAAAAALTLPTWADESYPGSGWGQLNMPRGVTDISRRIYDLHMTIFWVCVVIGTVVFGVMIWSIVTFRKSKGAVADVTLVHNTRVEVVWTVIPVIILIAMAVPAARVLVAIEDTTRSGLTIKVTGFQWGWQYDYLDQGVPYYSRLDRASDAARQLMSGIDVTTVPHYLLAVDHPLVVPVGTKVRLLITGADVIHSWWVSDFGVKKDAIPGFINEAWFKVDADKPGIYRGQCAELCGRDHGFMPIVVNVGQQGGFRHLAEEHRGRGEAGFSGRAGNPGRSAPGSAGCTCRHRGPAKRRRSRGRPGGRLRLTPIAQPQNRLPQDTRHGRAARTRRPARDRRPQATRLAALGLLDQSQGHRHDVPDLLVHDVLHRRRWPRSASGSSSSARACSSLIRSSSTPSPPCTA